MVVHGRQEPRETQNTVATNRPIHIHPLLAPITNKLVLLTNKYFILDEKRQQGYVNLTLSASFFQAISPRNSRRTCTGRVNMVTKDAKRDAS
jgi:hypothetical protein